MLRYLPLALLALPLAACDGQGKGGNSTQISITSEDDDGNTSIAVKDGNYSIKTPGFSGSFKLPGVAIQGDDLDIDGVKLPPKSRVVALDARDGHGDGHNNEDRATFRFETEMAPAETLDWFKSKMLAQGFRVETKAGGLEGSTRDGSRFKLDLSAKDKGTAGTYAVTG
jgi:hypothetical protein